LPVVKRSTGGRDFRGQSLHQVATLNQAISEVQEGSSRRLRMRSMGKAARDLL